MAQDTSPPDFEHASPVLDRPRSPVALAAVISVFFLLLVAGGVTYYFLRRPAPAVPESAPFGVSSPVPAAGSGAPAPAAVRLPPLDASDAFVREQLAPLGSDEWRSWLDGDTLARRFAGAVLAVADGKSPRRALDRPTLRGGFTVTGDADDARIDPSSYARYDRIADAVATLEVERARAAYRLLYPLLAEAWAEIGPPGVSLDDAARRAIDGLLATPDAPADAEVVLHEGLWRYRDSSLEALSAAQEHLLRMGPANAAKVRDALRRLRTTLS